MWAAGVGQGPAHGLAIGAPRVYRDTTAFGIVVAFSRTGAAGGWPSLQRWSASMEPSGERKLSAVPSPPPDEEDAAWRFLDAVWDVPVGLGLCDTDLRFIRVNDALAGFDGLSVDAHYEQEDTLAR